MSNFYLRSAVFALLLSLLVGSASSVFGQVCGYYYRKDITINGSQIAGGPHTDFPVLISHTDPDLATAAAKVTDVNGYDIHFADATGNPLDFQLEKYVGATGQVVAWVKIPSITNGTDVTIQIHYGNSTITTDQSTTATWSSGYNGVWHFNNNVNDVSGAGITSVNNGSTNLASSKIGDGRTFSNNFVELTNFPNLTTSFSMTAWINSNNVGQAGQRVFADDVNNTGGYAMSLGDPGSGIMRFYSRGSNPVFVDPPPSITNNTWYHVAAVVDITGAVKTIYVNGVQVTSSTYTNVWGTDAGNASIGGETNTPPAETGNRFNGRLDEVRVASRALSANWLLTEYRSQNQPTTTVGVVTAGDFYTVGSETSLGNPAEFGTNEWHAYAYNGNNTNNSLNSYAGYYVHNTLNFSSTDVWAANSTPSAAAGYVGCTVTNDTHAVRYKRQGFPCGYYSIDIAGPGNSAGHDDQGDLYIDGVSVWTHNGCCDTHAAVWTGFLGPNSTVEFRWLDNAGDSYGRVTFNTVAFPDLSPPVTICAGSSTTLTASGAANYDWSTNTTYLTPPFTNASVTVSPPGATPNSTQTYTVSTTDATTGCTVSNSVLVTIDPLPSTAVTPTSANYCVTGSVDVTATGANTYTWSPLTGVTVTSPSGHTATLSPATTTTYTVTGNNNCASNTATVTVTVNAPIGDPNDFGTDTWNVYAYEGNNFDTYYGFYVHNALTFDSRTVWTSFTNPSNASGYQGCVVSDDNHSYRYKRRGFPCGYYQLDIPNHDDYVAVIIDGVTVFSQDSWYAGVYKTNVWTGYLDSDSEIEYTIREFGGDSNAGLAFIPLFGPPNSASETIWTGDDNTNWTDVDNWCGGVPNSTISAYLLPSSNDPAITTNTTYAVNDLTIFSGVTFTISSNNRSISVHGDWTNNGTFVASGGNRAVIFTGTTANTIGGSSVTTFRHVTINNTNATALTLDTDMQVSGTFTFTDGEVYTNGNMVIFNDNAAVSGVSDNSYVAGMVRKIGNDVFTFPVGDDGYYAPVSISNPGNVNDAFTAQYFHIDPNTVPYDVTALGAGLHHVSRCEYWTLTRDAGTSNETVALSWNTPRSCGVDNLGELRLARWTGAQWTNHAATTTGNTTAGTITTTGNVTAFTVFTLASSTVNNPLPIELISFEGKFINDHVELTWTTASEINNDFFTIEKSRSGQEWSLLGTVDGAGDSSLPIDYSFDDVNPVPGVQFYRLKQTDFDGAFEYSDVILVTVDDDEFAGPSIYPNPANDEVNIILGRLERGPSTVQVIDLNGRLVHETKATGNKVTFSVSSLPSGVYMVQIIHGSEVTRMKLVRE